MNKQRLKLFGKIILIVYSIPLLILISSFLKLSIVVVIFFVPALFWAEIPARILMKLGIGKYTVSEFGVSPEGAVGWIYIVLFWLVVSIFLTIICIKTKEENI